MASLDAEECFMYNERSGVDLHHYTWSVRLGDKWWGREEEGKIRPQQIFVFCLP